MQGLAVTPPCFIFVEYFLPRLKEYFCWVVFFEIRVDVEAETLQSLHNEVDECLASLEEWREQRRKETRCRCLF